MSNRIFSIESSNYNSGLIGSRNVDYVDIDLGFETKPSNRDVYVKKQIDAVKQSVKHILLTAPYEKLYNPYFGTNLANLLFELDTQIESYQILGEIKQSIELYEPRAKVVDVDFKMEDNSVALSVYFQEVNTSEMVTLNVIIKRIR